MTWFLRAAVLTTLATTAGVAARSPSIEVPVGRPAVIDGVPEAGEWDDAVAVPLSGGGEVQLKHDGHDLFVSIRGQGLGSASLDLADGSLSELLVRGECPPELRFEPDTWFEITINREDVS